MNDLNQNQRLFITVALCLAVTVLWALLFKPKPGAVKELTAVSAPAAPAAPSPAPAAAPEVSRGTSAAASAPAAPRGPAQKVTFNTEKLHVVLTSDGAALESAELLGQKFLRHKVGSIEAHQVDLIETRPGEMLPLSTVVRAAAGTAPVVAADAPYSIVQRDARSATFRTEAGGLTVLKTITIDPVTYRLNLAVEVRSAGAFAGSLSVLETSHGEVPASGSFFTRNASVPARTICKAGDKLERVAVDTKTAKNWDGPGAATFVGIDEQFFLTAVVPPAGALATCRLESQVEGSLVATLAMPLNIPAGGSVGQTFTVFAGPKDTDELNSVSAALKDSVDFGFWASIANLLLIVMKFFHKVIPGHNWGIAIILLTLSMKALTFPLQHKSMKSMQEMQRIQPQLEELKKKYPNDTQRQNLEQMKLFKEHGVNPMGSCLPMVIQMPIWFALYTTLQVSVELYNAPFIPGWLNDLTAKDPYYILPVAMGITMIMTQVLTPTPVSNPSQKTMGYAMSGFFSLLMLNLPSGLTLYIFINNILSIIQQIYLRRTMRSPSPPASGQTVAVTAARV